MNINSAEMGTLRDKKSWILLSELSEWIGVEKDKHKAFIYYQNMEHAKSINKLGNCYRFGTGVGHKALL